jgi:hypothetical protein
VESFHVFVCRQRTLRSRRIARSQLRLIEPRIFCSMRYSRSFGSDQQFIPINTLGDDSATSTTCSTMSAKNFRGPP